MGCGGSRSDASAAHDASSGSDKDKAKDDATKDASAPVLAAKVDDSSGGGGASSSTPAIARVGSADDLSFLASKSAADDPPTTSVAPRASLVESKRVRVQVQLEGSWRDCSDEERMQMVKALEKGVEQFKMTSRGQKYDVDFTDGDGEGAYQRNAISGKKRRLRIVDTDFTDDSLALDRTKSYSAATVDTKDLPEDIKIQLSYGPQTRRGNASQACMSVLKDHPHAQECFQKFAANEARLCGDFAVFYHSYSFAALIYEVHAAVGSVLFRFRSQYATLPRILVKDFQATPDAASLQKRYDTELANAKKDHDPRYRQVAVSVMCSLASTGPEACIPMVFVQGYSCKDLAFKSVLENLLASCYVPKAKVKSLASAIIELSEKHGLDVSQFGGKPCESGKAGHLLQIFIKRSLLDEICYSAKPYGPTDEARMPISKWMNSNESFAVGQARIVAHPKYFMQANLVRMYCASADVKFHNARVEFQKELIKLMDVVLGEPKLREKAAAGIYGGSLPSWWTSEDQRAHAAK